MRKARRALGRWPVRARRGSAAGVLAGAVMLLPSGCGSSSGPGTVGPASTPRTTSTLTIPGPGTGKPPLTLGSEGSAEELVLGELYAQALRAKGYQVRLRGNLGSPRVLDRELQHGAIDGYPEYTGTLTSMLAHQPRRLTSAAEGYARAQELEQRRGISLLRMSAAQRTGILVAKPAYAARHKLTSLADLARLGRTATVAGAPAFRTRFSGLVGLRRVYGLRELRFRAMPVGTRYRALDVGRVELVADFSTDGRLSQGRYAQLADPHNIFGFQNETFVIRTPLLQREGRAFADIVNSVSARLSTQALRAMNAAVDLDQQAPAYVARQFLRARGLI